MEHSKAAPGLRVVLLLSRVLTHPSRLCASLSSCVMLRVRLAKWLDLHGQKKTHKSSSRVCVCWMLEKTPTRESEFSFWDLANKHSDQRS